MSWPVMVLPACGTLFELSTQASLDRSKKKTRDGMRYGYHPFLTPFMGDIVIRGFEVRQSSPYRYIFHHCTRLSRQSLSSR